VQPLGCLIWKVPFISIKSWLLGEYPPDKPWFINPGLTLSEVQKTDSHLPVKSRKMSQFYQFYQNSIHLTPCICEQTQSARWEDGVFLTFCVSWSVMWGWT
jgi:hypothetical protein